MLTAFAEAFRGVAVIRLSGVLDARTYRQARDAVIKAALDQCTAVIVDVDDLEVPDDSGWAAFTSARWHVCQWPEVVIALACAKPAVHQRLARLSISRYVPVYASVAAATMAIGQGTCRYRRRAVMRVGPHESTIGAMRFFVCDHLTRWSMPTKVPVAHTVATILVENALRYTSNGCDLRLESADHDIVVAVSDESAAPAIRRERPPGGIPTGLDIVAVLCRSWGNNPTSRGKTVWAQIASDASITQLAALLR
ncbi:STAS domain-containing protein [Mycobacterium kubicae]|uniref:STAS domain-containing protein n=1 Tax=Mycobacterium kubicae TaxID=120959 RepID=UPI0007FBB37D|nr:STAS domain-containing protein [Mycobacterium kubicae]OBK44698.1 hypothetical protein A5657_04175 [Mycobacterium kubicae]